MTNKKRYMFTSTRPLTNKLNRIVAYNKEPQIAKTHAPSVAESRDTNDKCYISNFARLMAT